MNGRHPGLTSSFMQPKQNDPVDEASSHAASAGAEPAASQLMSAGESRRRAVQPPFERAARRQTSHQGAGIAQRSNGLPGSAAANAPPTTASGSAAAASGSAAAASGSAAHDSSNPDRQTPGPAQSHRAAGRQQSHRRARTSEEEEQEYTRLIHRFQFPGREAAHGVANREGAEHAHSHAMHTQAQQSAQEPPMPTLWKSSAGEDGSPAGSTQASRQLQPSIAQSTGRHAPGGAEAGTAAGSMRGGARSHVSGDDRAQADLPAESNLGRASSMRSQEALSPPPQSQPNPPKDHQERLKQSSTGLRNSLAANLNGATGSSQMAAPLDEPASVPSTGPSPRRTAASQVDGASAQARDATSPACLQPPNPANVRTNGPQQSGASASPCAKLTGRRAKTPSEQQASDSPNSPGTV